MWSDMVQTHRRIQNAQIPERDAQVCNKLMLVHLDHSTARYCNMDRQQSEMGDVVIHQAIFSASAHAYVLKPGRPCDIKE